MRIHKFGNDYVQADKFEKESVNNVENQTADNRPEPSETVSSESGETEEATAKKEESRRNKSKKAD